ncbi:PRPF38B family protein [Megaselia abdita]
MPFFGNENSMNLNPLILTNIQSSSYFKVNLFKLKTYHEVVDEIYYQVKHMEPWERGSRKTSGQTGMCGGVRGVGAGGIVSTAYCLLYKLYTLRLTRKQVNGLLNHTDSPYIRGLGFMYLRYTLPPGDLYEWYEDYLQDEEEIDVKAGGGQTMTMGQMVYQFMTKLDWFSTLFPRIPVPIQKQIESKVDNYCRIHRVSFQQVNVRPQPGQYAAGRSGGNATAAVTGEYSRGEPASAYSNEQVEYRDRDRRGDYDYERPVEKYESRHRSERNRSRSRSSSPSRERKHKHKKHKKHKSRDRSRSRDREERHHEASSDRHKYRDRDYKRY